MKSDGTTLRQFGANPTGMAIFDARGRYIITVMRSDRAKYASNALWRGSAEENEATANGTQTYFGTYSVNDQDRSVAIHVEGSSFPNWNGSDQKRFVAITGDQLTLTIRPPSGESVDVVWKRAK
ncbi:lipocalin-like domain-containing protein [Bradyrhizobium diazoefficiens]|uniref:lipocalin-like domain-containing protein n=1 Tax=Bradyrhizobium diazoefficiens TaxID=1355477 RepID=UPI00190AD587|nr:lipocalin-like domain-containing protein [Bradyrhizobium diazoefficiens]QQO13254.1 lipocalin-like domain-containing protein [Bradyrhizobium diazoefficiens]QQO16848.1 lipocalin-like domain-containing protein [Bradyrhizobium diazoefficiens]